MLRSRLFDLLPFLPNLRILKLGSGSGGVSDVFHAKFLNGLLVMNQLVHFSLGYDCTDQMLEILQRKSGKTLKILDVEYSSLVTDASVNSLTKCRGLVQLHLFHTGITAEGHARLLMQLKNLRFLVRGDFLCEALEVVAAQNKDTDGIVFEIEEFWSSEQYYFHDNRQMELVAKMCPKIKKMMFQYSQEFVRSFSVLAPFLYLCELHNWGGNFYSNELGRLLEVIGNRLKVLYLIHVDELDLEACAHISVWCQGLQVLGFFNCIFGEVGNVTEKRSLSSRMKPLLSVEKLALVSQCPSPIYLVTLASSVLNVQQLITGASTDLDDATLAEIRKNNRLARLRELRVAKSRGLTVASLYSLADECAQLRLVRDLDYWESVNKFDLWSFRQHIRENNICLDTGEHRKETAYGANLWLN